MMMLHSDSEQEKKAPTSFLALVTGPFLYQTALRVATLLQSAFTEQGRMNAIYTAPDQRN